MMRTQDTTPSLFRAAIFIMGLLAMRASEGADQQPKATAPAGQKTELPDITFNPLTDLDVPDSDTVYVLCYKYDKSANPATLTPDSPADLTISGKKKVTCQKQPPDPKTAAVRAGLKLMIVVQGTTCTTLSDARIYVDVNKQPIAPINPNPLRQASGGGPTAMATLEVAGPKTGSKSQVCYVLFPDPLAADTLSTISIGYKTGKDADEKSNQLTQATLPDIHTYYKFGVSTGVAVSTVLTKTFGYSAGSTMTSFHSVTASDPPLVEPVLFLTYYFGTGLDPETKGGFKDLGAVIGFSEKSPTSSFYLGLSMEPIRNIAFMVGANLTQEPKLATGVYDAGPSAMHASPPTVNHWQPGAFFGVAFNFSNFLQTLFKGGGS